MAFIYKIVNDVNGKVYVGKTAKTIEERFAEHLKAINKTSTFHRPLYSAMRKYGVEHFKIEIIEECSIDVVNEREMYWISVFRSYEDGYNATKGGDGKFYQDYNAILELYNSGMTLNEVSKILHCNATSCGDVIRMNGYSSQDVRQHARKKICRRIAKVDVDTGKIINEYASIKDASVEYDNKGESSIGRALSGRYKTAYGYKWIYLDE